MSPEHERWQEFRQRLEGPEGCDFKEDDAGRITWECGGGLDKSRSATILRSMGFDQDEVADSLTYFEQQGGHCDCEVLFNVAPEQVPS